MKKLTAEEKSARARAAAKAGWETRKGGPYTVVSRDSGHYTVYQITNKTTKKIYIGKTKKTLTYRLNEHLGRLNYGTSSNAAMQEDFDNGNMIFAIKALSTHGTNDEARVAELEAIRAVPKGKSYNIRLTGRAREHHGRYTSFEVRAVAIQDVCDLRDQGVKITKACHIVGKKYGYSHISVWCWVRDGMPAWVGKSVYELRAELNQKKLQA